MRNFAKIELTLRIYIRDVALYINRAKLLFGATS